MCAIFGVWNVKNAAGITALGLHNNQHRAIDYAGIASFDSNGFHLHHGKGIARQVFTQEVLHRLPGESALGHIRYPTVADNNTFINTQPVVGRYGGVPFALAHNGNITNADDLRRGINPARMTTSIDSECIVRMLEDVCTGDIERDIVTVFERLEGSVTIAILMPDRLIAVKDRSGNRPLSISKFNGGYCISSETCAFAGVGSHSEHVSVPAGTMVSLSSKGMIQMNFAEPKHSWCRFEGLYFSHPGSTVFEESVSGFRQKLGRALHKHCPVRGALDIITPVPDSSTHTAIGFSRDSTALFYPVITRSHYVGRTFIMATQALRDLEMLQKFTFDAAAIKGKHIAVVDDSIMRGTTLPMIVPLLSALGALSVHVRIACPPIKHSCRYGIHTPTDKELISSSKNPDEICKMVGADSLEFLPYEALRDLSATPNNFCYACMNGEYW